MQFDNFAVGKAIRDLRKEKGISQDVLSGFAGIDIRPSELVARIEEEIENHT